VVQFTAEWEILSLVSFDVND